MRLHELEKNASAKHRRKRVGRGPGSGLGKTSGKGQKGQKSRSGVSIPATFEGGQLPLFRRTPKRGFNNKFRKEYAVVNLSDLNKFDENTHITPELLKEIGMVKDQKSGIKILGDGKLDKKLKISAHKFSKKAITEIKKSGSTYEVI